MDNRQQFPNYDYSTLEVAQQQDGDHTQAPPQQQDYSQHGYAHGGYPEQAYQTDPRKYSPQPYEGHNLPQVVDQTYPEVAPKPEGPEVAPKGDYGGYGEHQHNQHPVVPPEERRIWGLKRKTFFIVLAIALLVIIGAVVGGAVGGTVGKNGEKKGDNPNPGTGGGGGGGGSSPGNTTNNSPVLGTSRITAINWTDSSNVEYNAVFWQAKTNDLMMSLWDSTNNTWSQVNITDKMTDISISVAAKPGTPLAAAARGYPWTESTLKHVAGDFGIALFYLSPANNILEIYSEDPRGASWALGDLTTSSTTAIKAAPDTQLSAWWGLCERNCSGSILLVYEDDSQTLRLANSSTWNTTPVLRNIASGASLAITACSGNRGKDGPAANAVRLYYDSSNKLSELMWSPWGPWYYGAFFSSRPSPALSSRDTKLLQAPISRPGSLPPRLR
ncbi:hypothetical protein CONLIGDRAFT_355819 [Coniochaeta ligniaria NRRL 30616]|uniref:Fucose-specific lectin n=1 Tax=Coniochaeta ligniaria NRRL 30616 TaxID=1408157 RepID=A0A1J7IRP7_9PEZI|nr:hypothetical protein CONLIGDRAFT_355819 [Coniochaeta ligniaria NRRL 30616]